MQKSHLAGQKIAVIGLGRSGLAAAEYLLRIGASPFLYDDHLSSLDPHKRETLVEKGCVFGDPDDQGFQFIKICDHAVISPGIKPSHPIFEVIKKANCKILTEVDLAFLGNQKKARVIGVTGTNGKTTVTTLITTLLDKAGYRSISCGNIGYSFVEAVMEEKGFDYYVVELSSFQLCYSNYFRPEVGILLNLDVDHLDWHPDLDHYFRSKFRLFSRQTDQDLAVINREDKRIQEYTKTIPSRVVYFEPSKSSYDANFSCLKKVQECLELDEQVFEDILHSFEGLEHRMELVPTTNGLRYINDSKSTSLHSLDWAIQQLEGATILICGGKDKGFDFEAFSSNLSDKIKAVVTYGETKEAIYRGFSTAKKVYKAEDLMEAVKIASSLAERNETVLFSPGCASFDMFPNYVARGKKFKEIVGSL